MENGHAGSELTRGLLVVISAPSGAGKTSVLRGVMARRPELRFSVSATTRKPRAGERDGVDYHFLTDDEFDRAVAAGEFIEWAEVHGRRYGSLRKTVSDSVEKGETIVFDTDTVGARNIKRLFPDAVLIFIAPPSPEALRERLERRETETPESIRTRLGAAPEEMRRAGEYDYIVINDTLDAAIVRMDTILTAEGLRSGRMLEVLTEWKEYLHGEGPAAGGY